MDLLFSYKGGDEFMNNVLLYFALKHDGDFEKIYNDIKEKVPVDENEFIKLKRGLKTKYVTILDNNYPKVLKQIACPPFVLFYEGNIRLAKDLVVGDAFIYSSFNSFATLWPQKMGIFTSDGFGKFSTLVLSR